MLLHSLHPSRSDSESYSLEGDSLEIFLLPNITSKPSPQQIRQWKLLTGGETLGEGRVQSEEQVQDGDDGAQTGQVILNAHDLVVADTPQVAQQLIHHALAIAH